jgi:hypothetical protein
MKLHPGWKRVWATIIFLALGAELLGILRRKPGGDTLSEYTWAKTHAPVMRAALGGLLGWLVYHFLYAPMGQPLGTADALSTGAGILAGLIASRVRK